MSIDDELLKILNEHGDCIIKQIKAVKEPQTGLKYESAADLQT